MFHITSQQENVNQSQSEVLSHPSQNIHYQGYNDNKCWQECVERGTLLHCWWEYKLAQLLRKSAERFLRMLKVTITQLCRSWANTQRTLRPLTEICITKTIASLLTILRKWSQPRWPSSDEWIMKMRHNYTRELYLAF